MFKTIIFFHRLYKYTTLTKIFKKSFEDGHFYSTIPDVEEIFSSDYVQYEKSKELMGVNLNVDKQLNLLERFRPSINEYKNLTKNRYKEINDFFPLGDAVVIYSMLKDEPPVKVIEVGSGFSSAVFLDSIEELHLNVKFTFIEPYPERLLGLLSEKDKEDCTILKNKIQEIPLDVFKELNSGDILFIDSSHVSKLESDVNYIIFEILPILNRGVRVHFHDIFYPFEYPKVWLEKGVFWNEAYLLRSFLQYNSAFEIEFWGNYINNLFPSNEQTIFGGSIWLRKCI